MFNRGWVTYQKITDPGRNPHKQTNEDNVEAYYPEDEALVGSRGALYIVADGIGGEAHGEVASDTAIKETVRGYYAAAPGISNRDALVQAMTAANLAVLTKAQADAQYKGMGTTMTAMALQPDGRLLVANVGDSRGYIVRDGMPRQVTVDHTWVAEQIAAGILTPAQAETSRRRHQITRSMGRHPQVAVDTSEYTLQPDDRLLICSDGLSDVAADAEIAAGALAPDLDAVTHELVNLANSRGGPDNISVVAVHYRPALGTASAAALGGALAGLPKWALAALGIVAATLVVAVGLWLWQGRNSGGEGNTPTVAGAPATAAIIGPISIVAQTAEATSQNSEPTAQPGSVGPTATLASMATRAVPADEKGAQTQPTAPTQDHGLITVTMVGLDQERQKCGAIELLDDGGRATGTSIPMNGQTSYMITLSGASQMRYVGSSDGHCPWDDYNLLTWQQGASSFKEGDRRFAEIKSGLAVKDQETITITFEQKPASPGKSGGSSDGGGGETGTGVDK